MKNRVLFFPFAFFLLSIYSCSPDRSNFEQNIVNMEGKVIVTIGDDIVDGHFLEADPEVYFEETATGRIHQIDFNPENLGEYLEKTGKTYQIEGVSRDNFIKPIEFNQETETSITPNNSYSSMKKGGNGNGGGPGGGGSSVTSVLVVLISDSLTTPPCSPAQMEEILIGPNNMQSVANYFNTVSRGAFTINSVTTTSVYIDKVPCYIANLSYGVDPLVQAQGIDVASFSHVLYVSEFACPYGGRAELNGRRLHTDFCNSAKIIAHEFGHNLGLMHSSTPGSEYGDFTCVMGGSYKELNAPHRANLDWINGSQIASVRKSGTYTIAPLELVNPSDDQILVIKVSRNLSYYLSYRAPIGDFDSQNSSSFTERLSVHSWSEPGLATRFYGSFGANEVYTNAAIGVSITNAGIQNGVMLVSVNFL